MTSTIRFYSFKDIPLTRKQRSLSVVPLALLCAAIWRWSESVLFLMAYSYTVIGVTLHVLRFVRHRFAPRKA